MNVFGFVHEFHEFSRMGLSGKIRVNWCNWWMKKGVDDMERYSADLLPGFLRMMLRIRLVEEALVAPIVAKLAAKRRKRHKRVCPRI